MSNVNLLISNHSIIFLYKDSFLDFMVQHLKADYSTSDENVVRDTGGLMFAVTVFSSKILAVEVFTFRLI